MPPSSYDDEVIEGRVLSDEEVIWMEMQENLDKYTRSVIEEHNEKLRKRMKSILRPEERYPAFFRKP